MVGRVGGPAGCPINGSLPTSDNVAYVVVMPCSDT